MIPILHAQKLAKNESPAASTDTTIVSLDIPQPDYEDSVAPREVKREKNRRVIERPIKLKVWYDDGKQSYIEERRRRIAVETELKNVKKELENTQKELENSKNELVAWLKKMGAEQLEYNAGRQKVIALRSELMEVKAMLCSRCKSRVECRPWINGP